MLTEKIIFREIFDSKIVQGSSKDALEILSRKKGGKCLIL